MRIEFAEDIFAGTAVRNLSQSFRPAVKFAVGIGILKFFGKNAADGIRVVCFERLGPCLLELDESMGVLSLRGRACCAEERK